MTMPSQEGRRILVLSEDSVTLRLIFDSLKGSGNLLTSAQTLAEATTRLGRIVPDIIVVQSDLLSCAVTLRGSVTLSRHIPLVVLSRGAPGRLAVEGLAAGACAILSIPGDLGLLEAVIDEALKHDKGSLHTADLPHDGDASARSIGIATGLVMERFHIGEDAAYSCLRRCARARRQKVQQLADTVVAASELVNQLLFAIYRMSHFDTTATKNGQTR